MEHLRTNSLIHVLKRLVSAPVLVDIFAMMAAWHYWPWMPGVFFCNFSKNYVIFLNSGFESTSDQALTEAFAETCRPAFASAIGALLGLFWRKICTNLNVAKFSREAHYAR